MEVYVITIQMQSALVNRELVDRIPHRLIAPQVALCGMRRQGWVEHRREDFLKLSHSAVMLCHTPIGLCQGHSKHCPWKVSLYILLKLPRRCCYPRRVIQAAQWFVGLPVLGYCQGLTRGKDENILARGILEEFAQTGCRILLDASVVFVEPVGCVHEAVDLPRGIW
jgi:hypothetical protein